MPLSSCLSGQKLVDRLGVLKNFSESTLNKLIITTTYSNKLYNDCKDTLVEKMFKETELEITEEEYKKWRVWQKICPMIGGSPFNLCIRLNSASNDASNVGHSKC